MKYDPSLTTFYNQEHLSDISTHGYYKEKKEFYMEYLETLKGKKRKILDIACNDGILTKNYEQFGDVIGIDINENAIAKCKKKWSKLHTFNS